MKKHIKHVGMLVAGVFMAGSAYTQIIINPTDDSRVFWSEATPSHADLNKGTDAVLRAGDGQSAERHNRSFLEFDLSGLGAGTPIISAKLYLAIDTGHDPSSAINIHSVADDSWSEGTITWNNQPAHGAQVGTYGVVDATVVGTYVSADVTADVVASLAGDGLWSAMLKDNNEQDFGGAGPFDLTQLAIFRSKEFLAGDFTPYLEISTNAVAPNPTNIYSIASSDDARILNSVDNPAHADLNKGADTFLRVGDGANVTANRYNRSFLEFDLSGIASGETVVSAKLWLATDAGNMSNANINVHSVADDSWTEGAITWNNQPAHGAQVGTFGVIGTTTPGVYVFADVTADVVASLAGDGLWSGMLKDSNEQTDPINFVDQMAVFRSKEYAGEANDPYLEVITISAPVMTTITVDYLTGTGLEITWDAESTYTYTVLSKPDLTDPTWGTNQTGISGIDGNLSVTTGVTEAKSFYRVIGN